MDVALPTNAVNPSLVLRSLERWASEPSPGWRARLELSSGGFSAVVRFYFDQAGLEGFVASLRAMDTTLAGHAVLATPWEDPQIRFEVAHTGQVSVEGTLLDESVLPYQRMEFRFYTDQTCLRPFADGLAEAVGKLPWTEPAA